MAEAFLSEIRMMSFNFAPKGWALCNGQLLPINQNQALFSLLGTTYGGNGQTTFALPNLQGRTPIHMGQGTGLQSHTLGELGGEQVHTLSISEMPTHVHFAQGSKGNGSVAPTSNNILAASPALIYDPPANLTTLQPGTISNTGGIQVHENMQPYLTINFSIALQGIFPSRN
jgi:microcystin-dependent protein